MGDLKRKYATLTVEEFIGSSEHSTLEKLTFSIANTPASTPIIIRALAGSGKTHVLLNLLDTIGEHSSVLLLSFTRAAVRIARARSGQRLTTQTFDSFFHGLVTRSPEHFGKELEILEARELATEMNIDPHHRCAFEGGQQWYRLNDIRYVFVDEAQDSPPEAVTLLDRLRSMGKRLIVVGDPHQTIFTFMNTVSLFDDVKDGVVIPMYTSRRCCPEVAAAVNELFPQLDMSSNCFWEFKGESVVFQARTNDRLGAVYAKILFTLPWQCEVAGGDDTKFARAVLRTIRQIYNLESDDDAELVLKRRLCEPTRSNGPTLFFSTVHGFKGGEADVTVLCQDVDVTNVEIDYRLRYVAVTRAKFGVFDLTSLRWWGTDQAKTFLMDVVSATCRETAPKRVHASSITRHPVGLIRLGLHGNESVYAPQLRERGCYSEIRAILTSWALERDLRDVRVLESDALYGFKPAHDFRYKKMVDMNVITRQQHADVCSTLARIRIRAICIKAMVLSGHLQPTTRLAAFGAAEYARLRRFKRFGRLERIHDQVHPPSLEIFTKPDIQGAVTIAFGRQTCGADHSTLYGKMQEGRFTCTITQHTMEQKPRFQQ